MPVRMYALAKELSLDSKVLVDICTKAGVPGKGSALASLTDEEVVKVKEYMAAKDKPVRKPAAAQSSTPPVLEPPASKKAPAKSPPPSSTPPPEEPALEEEVQEQTQAPAPPQKPAATPAPALRREDYIAPGGVGSGRPRVLTDRPKRVPPAKPADEESDSKRPAAEGEDGPQGEAPAGPRTPKKSGPVLNLAPMPAKTAPKTEKKKNEPAPQKPIIALPVDAIRSAQAGSRPLAEQLRRVEQQSNIDSGKKSGKKGRGGKEVADEPVESPLRSKRGRGGKGGDFDEEEGKKGDKPLLGGREQRQLSRKSKGRRGGSEEEGAVTPRRFKRRQRSGPKRVSALPRKGNVSVTLPCTVRNFSEAIGVPAAQIIGVLLREGIMDMTTAKITANMDEDVAELVAAELGVEVEFKQQVSLEDELITSIEEEEDAPESLVTRPPVITFLGHVDHGKTSLLDKIIGLDVVTGESGGITQHIRAYQTEQNGQKISFVDTPGHEAFTEMRARGANVTDIAVLVVAADDGVMPQTEEAISHARAADVPIVVALNKCDLPGVDMNKIYTGLSANDLLPSEWGGDVEVVKTSALTGEGIPELLDTLLTVAELHDLKANPNRSAMGTCLEAQQEQGRGVMAKMIVQNGTLHVGDVIVCGESYGKVKALYDTLGNNQRVEDAGPSVPVNVAGLDSAPQAGQHFYVLKDIASAREIAERRAHSSREESLTGIGPEHVTLENLFDRLSGSENVQSLNVILRADTRGSIEAIRKELTKLDHDEVKVKILQATVGGVTEADIHLADASDAIVIAFNVVADEAARRLADDRGVQIRRYSIIYKVTDELKASLEGMLKPEKREVDLGRALVQKTFTISRMGTIAGCRVLAGTVERNSRVRVIRNNTIVGDYHLASLRREKDDTKEVREGMECGMRLDGFNDLKEGDILEVYRIEEVGRKFDD